jgi:hypothetical protein
VLYHQGRNAEALAAFDQACLMLLSYPDFMRRVTFDDPRPDGNQQRVQVPWGPGTRPVTLGNYPRTMQIAMGSMTGAQDALQRGGTFLQPQYWRLNVAEVIRTAALAMRRRNEILGPRGKHDRISKELAATMSRRNLTVANHWSQGWTELLAGIGKAGVGDAAEAKARLERAYAPELYFNDTVHTYRSRDEVVAYMLRTADNVESITVEVVDVAVRGNEYYLRWIMNMRFEMSGDTVDSKSVGMTHVRTDGSGQVVIHQDFWDGVEGVYQYIPFVGYMIGKVQSRM